MEQKRGRDVRVGDDLYFLGTPHRLICIEPYEGVNAPLWNGEARVGYGENDWGVTLDPDGLYEIG